MIFKRLKPFVLILLIIGSFLYIRLNFYEPFRIPSESMMPTLISGDFILVEKKAYDKKRIKRGDVVVFEYPQNEDIDYIKRVIGLPGEVIEIKNKNVLINGKALSFENLGDLEKRFLYRKMKTEQGNFVFQEDKDNHYKLNYSPRKIKKDEYFVMGDNRDFSYDSRFWGTVKKSKIKGQVIKIIFSLNNKNKNKFIATKRFWKSI